MGARYRIRSQLTGGWIMEKQSYPVVAKISETSRFYGIVIAMFYDEHEPPHFHARYGPNKAAVDISSLRVLEGRLPPRALGMVAEWANQHRAELLENWELVQKGQTPKKIQPLI